MAALFPFLRIRGWTFAKIGLAPTPLDTAIGVLLLVAFYAIWMVVWMVTVRLSPDTAERVAGTHIVSQAIALPTVVAVALVNPFFEEVFVCGYVMTALHRDKNMWLALNVSVGIRLLYHLYQGPLGVLTSSRSA